MIKVMSFNIRCATADDGDNNWEHRRQLVIDRIRSFDPNLLGLQECRADVQAAFVKQALEEYAFIGLPRGGPGATALEMAPLLYKRAAYEELDRGTYWLSQTPEAPGSLSWGGTFPRTVTWARLRCKRSPEGEFYFLNTHFDYAQSALEPAARFLRTWIEKNLTAQPVILAGDFNTARGSAAHRILTTGGFLQDALKDCPGSYHDFGRIAQPAPIDWILVSEHFNMFQVGVDETNQRPLYPSDHYPVTAELNWDK
jgi:endonuclease/exonuclease/phosphatase family metal-dependent hydrolase